jgi:hypothetical protein
MKTSFPALLGLIGLSAVAFAQRPEQVVTIRGDREPEESEKLVQIWLYPEDHEGLTIKLQGFIFEPEYFEYFPDINGYLFSCEPVNLARNNAFHAHVGNATFLSREKLNFFCSTADGQRIRQLFKERPGEIAMPAEVVIEITRRDYLWLGVLKSYTPRKEVDSAAPAPPNTRLRE